ncbi:FCS-Like Zinc finger 3 [Aristolochia californica]|uniref:FCS-Like Zinc finger 3 n=1 Tax=Aristolochia californica TaxID=171875 RepID=UPI0035DB540C
MDSGFSGTVRRSRLAEDEGLASLPDMEAGFSGKHPLLCASSDRRQTYRSLSACVASQPPRSALFYGARGDEPHHFLEACFMCKKTLGENRDIFMYRGDTPFCSEECRQEQIEIDETKEKNWNLAKKVSSRKENQKSPTKNQNFHARAGTVAAG